MRGNGGGTVASVERGCTGRRDFTGAITSWDGDGATPFERANTTLSTRRSERRGPRSGPRQQRGPGVPARRAIPSSRCFRVAADDGRESVGHCRRRNPIRVAGPLGPGPTRLAAGRRRGAACDPEDSRDDPVPARCPVLPPPPRQRRPGGGGPARDPRRRAGARPGGTRPAHGVRAPTQSPEALARFSERGWPSWPVGAGELTRRAPRWSASSPTPSGPATSPGGCCPRRAAPARRSWCGPTAGSGGPGRAAA